jgi:hypothetical protein
MDENVNTDTQPNQQTNQEQEQQCVRELTATDHINKNLLEKFRVHLEVIEIKSNV